MTLIEFPEQTVIIAKDQPEYMPLPAHRVPNDPQGTIVCCWKLTWRDLLKLAFTRKIWHTVLTFNAPLQPLLLSVNSPFVTPEPKSNDDSENTSDRPRPDAIW